jgi:poly-gamma-glutamate synthesis protein (capsule biosynthesis protein)
MIGRAGLAIAVGVLGGVVAVLLQRSWVPPDPEADRAAPLAIARAPSAPGEATLLFAGDTAEADAALPTLAARGFEYPFSLTVDLVRDADLAVVNVEAPLTDRGREFPLYKDYLYRAPARSAAALAWAGFDVIQLANNHAIDYGAEGLVDTVENAARAGLVVVGAGQNAAAARRGVVATVGALRVGLLAYAEDQFLWRAYVDQFARRDHAGVAALTVDNLRRDVARLRPQVDVLVVSFHIGEGYRSPEPRALAWSRFAVELGADLVVNHHPHVAQPIAMWRGRPIFLSIGNYAFGTPGQFGRGAPQTYDCGLIVLAHARGKILDRVEAVPLAVDNARVGFRPAPLDGEERDRALAWLRAESAPLGAEVAIERGRAVVYPLPARAPSEEK